MQLFKFLRAGILKALGFMRSVFSKKTLNKIVGELTNPDQSDELKAFSAAFGIFMGIVPIWGLQTFAAIFLAMVFKLNKTLVVIFSQVSFPPLFPLIVVLSYRIGRFWIQNNRAPVVHDSQTSFQNVNTHLEQYIYGSLSLAIAASIITGFITFSSLKLVKTIKQYRLAASLK